MLILPNFIASYIQHNSILLGPANLHIHLVVETKRQNAKFEYILQILVDTDITTAFNELRFLVFHASFRTISANIVVKRTNLKNREARSRDQRF